MPQRFPMPVFVFLLPRSSSKRHTPLFHALTESDFATQELDHPLSVVDTSFVHSSKAFRPEVIDKAQSLLRSRTPRPISFSLLIFSASIGFVSHHHLSSLNTHKEALAARGLPRIHVAIGTHTSGTPVSYLSLSPQGARRFGGQDSYPCHHRVHATPADSSYVAESRLAYIEIPDLT